MPLPSNIHAYADVAAVLDQVIKAGSTGRFTLDTEGEARRWQMRANKYRQLLQKQTAAAAPVKGYTPATLLDRMKLTLEGCTVVIDLNPPVKGRLSLPNGKVITPEVDPKPSPAARPSVAPPFGEPIFPEAEDALAEAARLLLEQNNEN